LIGNGTRRFEVDGFGFAAMNDQERLNAAVELAHNSLRQKYGSVRNDYYGLIFIEKVLGVTRERALSQNAFGSGDKGIDGFHFDEENGTFYIFQFKASKDVAQIHTAMKKMAEIGLPEVFKNTPSPDHQPILDSIKESLLTSKEQVERVRVEFVFRGDAEEVMNGAAYDALQEEIENNSWRFEELIGNAIPIEVNVLSFDGLRPEAISEKYPIRIRNNTKIRTIDGIDMYVGFVPIVDILTMHNALGSRFFERNVRFGLGSEGHVNRSLARAFRNMFLNDDVDVSAFAVNHNGITLSGQALKFEIDPPVIMVPRLLNGAQTISTLAQVWAELNSKIQHITTDRLDAICVLCKVIVSAPSDAITRITINSNRQNPIDSWLLHANDLIQSQFVDFFRPLGIFYQRQASAFQALTQQDKGDQEITSAKPIEMLKLAKTYLAADGELNLLLKVGDVADNERNYAKIFNTKRLKFNPKIVVMCYKIQFHLSKIANGIEDVGPNKYAFVHRGKYLVWGLICQAFLNDPGVNELAETYGVSLRSNSGYVDILHEYAKGTVRKILGSLVGDPEFKELLAKESYSFLLKSSTFDRAMGIASSKKFGWSRRQLLV
jgi:AIPR protein